MRCARRVLCVGLALALCKGLPAQGAAEGLLAAQQKIAAKEWVAALDLLLPLQEAVLDAERGELRAGLAEVAKALTEAGSLERALQAHEALLAMCSRLHGGQDHRDVAGNLNNVAYCLWTLGRADDALRHLQASLAMSKRLHEDRDHSDVAKGLNNVAHCLWALGRAGEALPQHEASLAMKRRLYGDGDHLDVATSLNNLGLCLQALGRVAEALSQHEASLATRQRLYGDGDHPDVATSLNNVGSCLSALGRAGEALPQFEASLAMYQRHYRDRDHPEVARSLNNLAHCLWAIGRADEALPRYEASLAMRKRVYGDRDHADVAGSLSNVASCLQVLGRGGEALPRYETSLAIYRRLYGDRDLAHVAQILNSVAVCLQDLGRAGEALPHYEASLAMNKRLYGDSDHPDVARSLHTVAGCLQALGRAGQALPQFEAALAMRQRLYGDRDHPDVAGSLSRTAHCLFALGRADAALPQFEAALAMRKRVYGDRDHPDVAGSLDSLAGCLGAVGRAADALPQCELAVAMIERLRDVSRTSAALRQSMFDELKQGGAFERLQLLTVLLGRPADALHAAERSRGRDLLDLLEQQRSDPLDEAERRARQRGHEATVAKLVSLRNELAAANLESDRLLHLLTQLDALELAPKELDARRQELLASSNAASTRQRQLLDERTRLLGDVLPVGRVHTAPEIQAALRTGELFLEFTLTADAAFVYVLGREGNVEAMPLPGAFAVAQRVVPDLLRRSSSRNVRGRDPDAATANAADARASRELFESLIPKTLWPRLQASTRVFAAAHRGLHRLPLELLVTEVKEGSPVYWLDSGPAVSYVPSGSALHWLRVRANGPSSVAVPLGVLAIGDPQPRDAAPPLPEQGVLVQQVIAGGEAARVGIQPSDVLTSYDGQSLADDAALTRVRTATEAAIQAGERAAAPVPVEVWRGGTMMSVQVQPGRLGITIGVGTARGALEASLDRSGDAARFVHKGDLERIARLPQLQGARAEAEAIAAAFRAKESGAELLLGERASEGALFELAAQAKHLHFACHGIAEEYAGQSLSMLVLSQTQHVLPEDDGLLKLSDLLHRWRGRLDACRLVVLSACRTNVGPTLRDDAPQALPIGFLFAGVPSVISSLWAVDDASTRELMVDFYGRLLEGETDTLAAFTAAKKALRQKHPDPFHWAPFLYIGSPE